MTPNRRAAAAASALLIAMSGNGTAFAQKQGGILRMSHFDSPASMSMHEEATGAVNRPMMGVFNNLVMFNQHVAQNSMGSIVPDLAAGWSWNEEGTELTMPLRQGVRWHDGKPFTAKDVQCTWDLLTGKSAEKLRLNPRKSWYRNLEEVTTNGEYEVTFRLKRPQPSFLAMLAAGWSPVYPCHVSPRDLRSHPIGTGPFKFVEFRPNEYIRVARNPDYWKPGRPYLDGIEWTIVPSLGTRILGFIAGKFDQVFGVTIPLLRDLKSQAPQAVCDMFPANLPRTLLVNRTRPPFDSPELRRAMAFSLDQQAFIDIEEQPERGPHAMVRLLARVVGIGIETADMLVNEVHMGRLDEAREAVERLRSLTNVVVPSAAHWRSPENRELYLSGLRLAAGETK